MSGAIDVRARLRHDAPLFVMLAGATANLDALEMLRTYGWGWDAHAYYLAATAPRLDYSKPPNVVDAYLYSPVFAQVLRPLALLPWPVFAAGWSLAALITLALLLRGVKLPMRLALLFASLPEVISGNVHWLIAAAVAFGLTRPFCWAIPALTKVSTGVGIVWFAVRREWSRLAAALLLPLMLIGISYAAEPAAWQSWVDLLTAVWGKPNSGAAKFAPPAVLRIGIAFMLTIYAARSSRPWLVAVSVCLASPNWALPALVILYAIPRLRDNMRGSLPADEAE